MAHSLGNMLVSAARRDHGLQYAKYFMLNAAVPIEAYDIANGVTAESKAGMTNPDWVGYPDRVRASHAERDHKPHGCGLARVSFLRSFRKQGHLHVYEWRDRLGESFVSHTAAGGCDSRRIICRWR